MAVRTSPRKKRPGAAGQGGASPVGAPYAEHSRPKHRGVEREVEDDDDDDDDDELPELSTLLGCTAPADEEGRKGRKQGERLLSPNKKKQGGVSVKMSRSSASRNESRTEQVVEKGDSMSGLQSAAMLPRTSSASLVLGATPSLLPTAPATPAITTTTTTTITSSRSSRQTMQRRQMSPAKQENTVSPIKRSIGAFPKQCKDDAAYPEPQSLIPGSRAASGGPLETVINGGSNRRSRSLKLQPVNSLLLPLRSLTLDSKEDYKSNSAGEDVFQSKPSNSKCKLTSRNGRGPQPSTSNHTAKARVAMFVLNEAACKDDDGDDDEDLESEDDFTDLSGFIVGDDEDISLHGSETDSASALGRESDGLAREKSPGRKRLMRGASQSGREESRDLSDALRSLSLEDTGKNANTSRSRSNKKEDSQDCLAHAISEMNLNDGDRGQPKSSRSRSTGTEVIDLTSPVNPRLGPEFRHQNNNMPKRRRPLEPLDRQQPPPLRRRQQDRFRLSESDENAADDVDDAAILRFSPPPRNISPFQIKGKSHSILLDNDDKSGPDHKLLTTPPQTPPASPSKLKSPSKLNSPSKKNPLLLLSPSKRGAQIPQSPHRQSIDAFWSSEVINEWNDAYSPAKPPLTLSPRKRWKIFDENENESEGDSESGSGSESPSESPARRRREPSKGLAKTPARSPGKKAATEEKKLAVAAKRKFDAEKEKLAHELLKELDERVTEGQLACLSRSTGGVKISWSKNLRSTAGRANWRRTVVTKASLDDTRPAAATVGLDKGGVKEVQHHASIELAEKIIDNEERLVNTLAHEFCHLANFMVSGVRDRPHGVEFKSWAAKVTSTFRHHERDIYRQVEVTTKHNYKINHKYLWVCVGTPPNAAKGFLNLPPEEEGCGAEYGRHSKSIDPARHRCGRCKGVLLQVRPRPRSRLVGEPAGRSVGRSAAKKKGEEAEKEKEKGRGLQKLEQAMAFVRIGLD